MITQIDTGNCQYLHLSIHSRDTLEVMETVSQKMLCIARDRGYVKRKKWLYELAITKVHKWNSQLPISINALFRKVINSYSSLNHWAPTSSKNTRTNHYGWCTRLAEPETESGERWSRCVVLPTFAKHSIESGKKWWNLWIFGIWGKRNFDNDGQGKIWAHDSWSGFFSAPRRRVHWYTRGHGRCYSAVQLEIRTRAFIHCGGDCSHALE